MKKKTKIVLILIVALTSVLLISGGYFLFLNFFKSKPVESLDETGKDQSEEGKKDQTVPVVVFIESISQADGERNKVVVLNLKDQSVFESTLPENIVSNVPVKVKDSFVYYLLEQNELEKEDAKTVTFYRQDIESGEKEKLAVSNSDSYLRRFWLSSDGKYIVLERVFRKIGEFNDDELNEEEKQKETRSWQKETVAVYRLDLATGREEEIISKSLNINLETFSFLSGNDNLFYYFEQDDQGIEINAVNPETKEKKKAFPLINYDGLSFVSNEFSHFYISPNEKFIVYTSQNQVSEKKSTDLFMINLRNGAKEEIISKEGIINDVQFSEDSNRLAFVLNENEKNIPEVWISDLEGKNQTKVVKALDKGKNLYLCHFFEEQKGLLYIERVSEKYSRMLLLEGDMYSERVIYNRDLKPGEKNVFVNTVGIVSIEKDSFPWKAAGITETLISSSTAREESSSFSREEIVNYLTRNLKEAIRRDPYIGEEWEIIRIGFPEGKENDVYVIYDDNHEMGKSLLGCEDSVDGIVCNLVGSFIPKNGDWELTMGEDPYKDSQITYLLKDKDSDRFIITYKSGDKNFFSYLIDLLRDKQQAVNLGEEIFRRDPLEVAKNDIPASFDFDKGSFSLLEVDQENSLARVKVSNDDQVYTIILEQLIEKGSSGIWTLISIEKNDMVL